MSHNPDLDIPDFLKRVREPSRKPKLKPETVQKREAHRIAMAAKKVMDKERRRRRRAAKKRASNK